MADESNSGKSRENRGSGNRGRRNEQSGQRSGKPEDWKSRGTGRTEGTRGKSSERRTAASKELGQRGGRRPDRVARPDATERGPERGERRPDRTGFRPNLGDRRSDQARPDRAERGRQAAGRAREPFPEVPEGITGRELDDATLRELSSLTSVTAQRVAQHLVTSGLLMDEDPETAYEHAVAARRLASRLGVVRETVGLAAYRVGKYDVALAELRTARRISGSVEYWPVMADCQRGLGHPDRALEMAAAPEVGRLDAAGRAEMRIVAAGARRDLGQPEAAVLTLQGPELNTQQSSPWVARLRYAYAEALETVGRSEEAARWFALAAQADEEAAEDEAFLDLLEDADGREEG